MLPKKVLANVYSNIVATLIGILSPLIVIPILTSGLGMEGYGEYVTLLAKVGIFIVLGELGFGMYISKEVSIHRDNSREISNLTWIYLISKLLVFIVVIFVFLIFSNGNNILNSLLCLFLLFQLVNITPILMGLEEYKLLTKIQLVTKTILVILVLLVDLSVQGIEKVIAIQVVISGLTTLFLFFSFIRKNQLMLPNFGFNKFRAVLFASFPFYGARLFVNLYQQSSTYFVSFILSAELVAIYSIAIQLYQVGQSVVGSVARVLYTSTVNTKNFLLVKRYTWISIVIHLVILPLVIFYGENILLLIFDFDPSVLHQLSILLFTSLIFVIVSSYWGYPVLVAIGKENYAHLGILISSIAYFFALLSVYFSGVHTVLLVVICIVIADFTGMVARLYFAKRFKLI